MAENTAGRRRFPAPSGLQFDAAARATGSLGASGFYPEDSPPASPVDQPGAAAAAEVEEAVADVQPREPAPAGAVVVVPAEAADVKPLAREPVLAGAEGVGPVEAAAVPASLLLVRVARPVAEEVVSLPAATVQA